MSTIDAAGRVVQHWWCLRHYHGTWMDAHQIDYTYESVADVLIAQQRGCWLGLCRA